MVAAPALIDLGVLLALVVLVGLSFGYRYSLGALLQTLVLALNAIRLPSLLGGGRIFGVIADALDKLDHAIRHALGRGVTDMQAAWNDAVSYTAYAVGWIGKELANLTHDTAQAIEGLHVTQVTNVYKRVAPRIDYRVGALVAELAALKARVARVAEREAHWAKSKVIVIERAVAVPNVGAIPRTIPRVGELEREAEAALRRARELARRFGPAVILGTIVAAIARLGFGWVRCAKVGRAGRQVCGMNEDLLASLLADTLLVVGTVSLLEFAREMQLVTRDAVGPIKAFWRVP